MVNFITDKIKTDSQKKTRKPKVVPNKNQLEIL